MESERGWAQKIIDLKPIELLKTIYRNCFEALEKYRTRNQQVLFSPNRLLGVFSCSGDGSEKNPGEIIPIENPIMWSHYAKNHEGVAFSFNEDLLDPITQYLQVEYRAAAPSIKPSISSIRKLHPPMEWHLVDDLAARQIMCTKHTTWSYEHEFRALISFPGSAIE